MDVLLIAGYRNDSEALGLSENQDGQIQMDLQISKLQQLGLTPIVVLAGLEADDVLRKSKKLSECELIYDTHGNESSIAACVKAGLQGVEHTCFVLPVEVPCPSKDSWVALRKAFLSTGFSTKIAMVQLTDTQGAPWHYGFPLFITRLGRHLMLNDEEIHSLTDPKLSYHQLDFTTLTP